MSDTYAREAFKPVPGVRDAYYCPGCNASAEDAAIPSVGCPCATHGSGQGALTGAGVDRYVREGCAVSDFAIKDSGKREEFPSGMRRDTEDGKPDYTLIADGPMLDRWAEHMTKGSKKYGERNWQLAKSEAEYKRFRRSAFRHFLQWLRGNTDEDHAAAVIFNIDAAEYVRGRMSAPDDGDDNT